MKYLKSNKIIENNKKAMLISAFPGCGKSHLYKNPKGLTSLDRDWETT